RIAAVDGVLRPGDLRRQLGRAYEYVGSSRQVGGETTTVLPGRSPAAHFSPETLSKLARRLAGIPAVASLIDRSPVDPLGVSSEDFLLSLYEPGEKVLVFTFFNSQGQALFDVDRGRGQNLPK